MTAIVDVESEVTRLELEELPAGWTIAALCQLIGSDGLLSDGDWIETKDQDPAGDVRLIQLADVGDGVYRNKSERYLTSNKAAELKCTFLKAGDILIARMPDPLGRACIFPGDPRRAVTAVDVCIVRPGTNGADSQWICHILNSPNIRERVERLQRGTTRQRVSRRNLEAVELAVPPLAEQRRIVLKVDALLTRVNGARAQLARVPTILKHFRHSVLAAACSGRLTEDWRETNPNFERATALLECIREARKQRKAKPVAAIQDSNDTPYEDLPSTWTECQVAQIALVCLGATPSRKEPTYWDGGIPWVSSGEVANCRISDTVEKITDSGLENSNAKLYPPGSVLIAMIGEGKTRGQSAILAIEACTNQNVAALLFDTQFISGEYIWRWALGEYERNRAVGRGGAQPALNGQKVRELWLPLPPLSEQHEIVPPDRRLVQTG